MYTPRHFAEHDLAALDALIAHNGFVTMTHVRDGVPTASHLPVLYSRTNGQVLLRGHWSRANPQWHEVADQTVLVIVHGPHAYVSPTWYMNPDEQVPTWNYAVAHLYGRVETTEDAAELEDIVTALAQHYEHAHDSNWRFAQTTAATQRDLRGIVGFRFKPDRIELKFKLNQNHPQVNRDGVIIALERHGGDERMALAALMRQRSE